MNRIAFVTGGGYGIGAAITQKLSETGYEIGIFGRSEDALRKQAEHLNDQGYHCEWQVCDVSDWENVVSSVSAMEEKLGDPTVLVNNAGGWLGDPIETINPSQLRSLVEATIIGTMFFSKAIVPGMRRRGGGFVLNIGSTSGLSTTKDSAVASAPKAAIEIFTRAFGNEVAKYHIKVAVLHPSRVNKKVETSEAEGPTSEGLYKNLSPRQVAEIAIFMIEQPPNVLVREVIVTPSDVSL